jgi:hypothetical protein
VAHVARAQQQLPLHISQACAGMAGHCAGLPRESSFADTLPPPSAHRETAIWSCVGPKIPSFCAVLLVLTEPQRLAGCGISVSEGGLSLFTRTSPGKVRSEDISFFQCYGRMRVAGVFSLYRASRSQRNTRGGRVAAKRCVLTSDWKWAVFCLSGLRRRNGES